MFLSTPAWYWRPRWPSWPSPCWEDRSQSRPGTSHNLGTGTPDFDHDHHLSPVSACNSLPQGLGELEQAGRRFYQLFPTFKIWISPFSNFNIRFWIFSTFNIRFWLFLLSISDSDFFVWKLSLVWRNLCQAKAALSPLLVVVFCRLNLNWVLGRL